MKTLLRQVSTGLFFSGPSRWSPEVASGVNFKSIDRALDFIKNFNLHDVEIVFAFKDSNDVTTAPPEKVAVKFSDDE